MRAHGCRAPLDFIFSRARPSLTRAPPKDPPPRLPTDVGRVGPVGRVRARRSEKPPSAPIREVSAECVVVPPALPGALQPDSGE